MFKQEEKEIFFACARACIITLAVLACLLTAVEPVLCAGVERSWLEDLYSPDSGKRQAAAQRLESAGPDALPDIADKCRDRSFQGRMVALTERMGPEAVDGLLALLSDARLRNSAGFLLSTVIDPRSAKKAPELLACVRNNNVARNYCGMALVKAMSPKAKGQLKFLREALSDPEPEVRAYAAAAIGQIGPKAKSAVDELALALQDQNPRVRLAAAAALGKMGGKAKKAVAALEAAALDPNLEVRQASDEALRQIRG